MKNIDHGNHARSVPELLAPAGSIDAFHAAVEAGADAVYLGLTGNNARLRAKNFTMKTLSYIIPYARKRSVKVQVALNTLLKQHELMPMLDTLFQLDQLGVDAVILQDVGLARVIQQYFPRLVMHASTQMAVHNGLGVLAAQQMGMKRVILARELTLSEIESIRKSKPKEMELEVFVHGALCYCISGMCLASSFLGGMSGNRGRCTQVCRRRFAALDRSGFYFSPKDLSLIDHVHALRRIGVDSLKIEGRMKGPEYVYTVVSAFRLALDSPSKIDEARERLCRDFGREKTPLFFISSDNADIIVPSRPSGSGVLLGTIEKAAGDTVTLRGVYARVRPGDRIRFHGQEGFEGESVRVAEVSHAEGATVLKLRRALKLTAGDTAFVVGTKSEFQKLWDKKTIDVRPIRYRESCPFAPRIFKNISKLPAMPLPQEGDRLFIRIDNPEWLHHIPPGDCDGVIVCPEPTDIRYLTGNDMIRRKWLRRLIISLPPFIAEGDVAQWRQAVDWLRRNGVTQWMCSNIGQRYLEFGENDRIYAGTEIWCMNRAAQQALAAHGYARFSYSPEDDILNIKACISQEGFFTLFALVPLFVSRIAPASPDQVCTDAKGNRFFTMKRNKLYYLVGAQPLCLTQRRDTLHELGLRNFVLDVCFCPPRQEYLFSILALYREKRKMEGSTLFNHKAGLH